ncbi:penicillin acylase family protein [Bacillus pseudomycoides]|uniref:penicillin acylase family protein n=1 Tax=Bacillus pseudomycoides TaxID=64104 RepID=UPI000BECDB4F|nr:penicillin acylase family protein [Bacillus pseudomycoides]PDX98032.1 penicillin acylase family protein [Bacillus pseudomycoides]PEK73225.1 penicillin acylase family protein [Bacillus pseudomycoides]PEN07808.1 penicillin acylase family protein [Bacillus pseudomycoides]PGB84030.1 penicillin acylase family protein [Bacillus pseudomycoides]PHE52665.1 penicillin acylase family protein [Bacillus pseudomycoides]
MEVVVKQRKKRGKGKKIVIWFGSILLFLLVIAAVFVNAFVMKSMPKVEGTVHVSGLQKSVQVTRDERGVPHIKAENEHDLYFSQGYVQAQDRLFQMDLSRRQASGTLGEVVGKAALDKDKLFRTLGLRRAAEASVSQYTGEAKDALESFADGVNAFIKEAKKDGKLPVEFHLLGYEPAEWTPVDSLTIGKYMAFDLGGHWHGQAFRFWALQHLSKEQAYELFPTYPTDAPRLLALLNNLDVNVASGFAKAIIPPESNGSNNWVVSGEKSASGMPILADDPHLSLATPSIWYQTHLEMKDINVSGVIFAGVPGVMLGHNKQIAWGVTNTGPDVQDLYIEKRNPDNPNEFLYNDKWEKATIVNEPIKVKGEKTIPYEVTITRHGPVISEFAYKNKDEAVFALRWTALEPSAELKAVLNMNKATNWTEFESALEDFHTPTQNFLFASTDGTIAYKANGNIPIRKKGDGILPVPGWTDEYEWEGYIPFDKLPKVINPEQGFISTANNKIINDDYPYHISHIWAQPYRQMRIQEFLQEKDKLTTKYLQTLQMDQKNLQAREFVPVFVKELNKVNVSDVEKQGLKELTNWDFYDNKEKAAPLIFHLWMKEISNTLFSKEIPKDVMGLFEGKQQVVEQLIRKQMNGENSVWFSKHRGFKEVLHTSYSKVMKKLEKQYGSDVTKWKWGEYHKLSFRHPMSQSSQLLGFFFNREKAVPVGGSNITVQAASYGDDGIVNHGASWRFVIDTKDMSNGYHIVGPGQSGHFKSDWYHDQIEDWVNGNYHATTLRTDRIDGKILTLKPQ